MPPREKSIPSFLVDLQEELNMKLVDRVLHHLRMGTSETSACICIKMSLLQTPPSTSRDLISPQSARIAFKTSRFWKAMASRTALQM